MQTLLRLRSTCALLELADCLELLWSRETYIMKNKDSDQTVRMHSLIWLLVVRISGIAFVVASSHQRFYSLLYWRFQIFVLYSLRERVPFKFWQRSNGFRSERDRSSDVEVRSTRGETVRWEELCPAKTSGNILYFGIFEYVASRPFTISLVIYPASIQSWGQYRARHRGCFAGGPMVARYCILAWWTRANFIGDCV